MKDLEEIRQIKSEVEADILKLPGVTGVDIGHKFVKGEKTNILAIRVYVKEKKDIPSVSTVSTIFPHFS
jgi:hypothetical protein